MKEMVSFLTPCLNLFHFFLIQRSGGVCSSSTLYGGDHILRQAQGIQRLDLSQARPKDSTSPDVDEKFSPLPERGYLCAEEDAMDANTAVGLSLLSMSSWP